MLLLLNKIFDHNDCIFCKTSGLLLNKSDEALAKTQALAAIPKTTPQGCNFSQSLSEKLFCNT